MKTLTPLLMSACMALAAGSAIAQDAMKKADPMMKKDAMATTKPMTMQECTDYMAMAKKDATKKDAKKDTMCTDMMNKDKPKK